MTDYTSSGVNGYTMPTDPGEASTGMQRMSINDVEGRILSELVRGLMVFEIGTGLGVSTRWMSKTAYQVHTFDPDPWVWQEIFPTLPRNVTTYNILPILDRRFDACFIDGWHDFEHCAHDIEIARRIVKGGGLILFHDLYLPGVEQAIMGAKLKFVHIQTVAGMAMAWND